ncbi:APC family permease [Flavobacterium crassostreae]|uniref:Amino acid permease n=1 Tax=Flavobacterium crassostreae TaxID=1763534 RepID=A0A1B9DMM4_9FLAO|nr:APC family permease [Flavobacterium crassostreae]OCB70924.1 amino acid permease [Flavobacterium crassostreae]
MSNYKKNSLTLTGAVSLGTGVMIGAGIFALLGQVAALSGELFPYAFLIGAIISGCSAYAYIKMSNAYPSAGGIAMYLKKAYGFSTITAAGSLLMAFSMIIGESLVARTFGTYTLQLFDISNKNIWTPILGVLLLIIAFLVNISGNKAIERSSFILAVIKIGGLSIFAIGGLWAVGFSFSKTLPTAVSDNYSIQSYIAALAFTILSYKGFTTITNSGGEIVNPKKNVGYAIMISLLICTVVYLLVAFAVASNLSIPEIITAKDFSLAEASKPTFGKYGLWFTVGIAIVATISGVIASIFAVSRMTAMLTEAELIPHKHFGMPGSLQKHMLVYTVVIAIILTAFFDLSRIASLGAIFYLTMDIMLQWGVLKNLRKEINANVSIIILAIVLDLTVLTAFIWVKLSSDPFVVLLSSILMVLIFIIEKWFLKLSNRNNEKE